MSTKTTLLWHGPFVFVPQPGFDCVFQRLESTQPGLYLWTIEHDGGYLVNYVGETGRALRVRLEENVRWSYSGQEGKAAAPEQFRNGIRKLTSFDFPEFLADYPKLSAAIHEVYCSYRVFIVPSELDDAPRKYVEAGIIRALRAAGGKIRSFLANRAPTGGRSPTPISVEFLGGHNFHGLGRCVEC